MDAEERAKAHRVYVSIRSPREGMPDGEEIGGSAHYFKARLEAQQFAKWISDNAERIKQESAPAFKLDDETKLICLQLLETIEGVYSQCRPQNIPASPTHLTARTRQKDAMYGRIDAIKKRLLSTD